MRLVMLIAALLYAPLANARDVGEHKSRRLTLPKGGATAVVRGFIGGEDHDRYIVSVKAGMILQVRITSKRNSAITMVSATKEFSGAEPAGFGTAHGNLWRGRVPATADYYIFVVAHPDSTYTLRVTAG